MKHIAVALCTLVALSGCHLTLDGDPDASAADVGSPVVDGGLRIDGGIPGHPGTVTVRGRVCTAPQIDQVKILFVIDSSGSMCLTDGPGSQASTGLCEVIGEQLRAQGVTVPGRVRALKTLMQHLALQQGVSVALMSFDSIVSHTYPRTAADADGYVPATDAALTTFIDGLQNSLGKGTDYQGALAEANAHIAQDAQQLIARGGQAKLAKTRYVTVFLSDGFPYPRCSAHDDLGSWASAADPSGVWQDAPATFCNTVPSGTGADAGSNPECLGTDCPPDGGTVYYSDEIPTFAIGGDRNQNAMLFAQADGIAKLKDLYGIAEVRLDTVMLYNTAALALCGDVCYQDLYAFPGGTPNEGRQVARWTLKQLAMHGRGSFREYTNPDQLSFGWVDTSDVGQAVVAKAPTPFVHRYVGPLAAEGSAGFPGEERPIRPDQDGDGFPDAFETAHAADGFDPAVSDARGCKSVNGAGLDFVCTDADGDGLSEPMEIYLGTNPFGADSDADGLPDGLEVAIGLDPLKSNAGLDGDGDQTPDIVEVLKGTQPTAAASASYPEHGEPQVTAAPQADGTTCYDFVVSDVWLNPSGISGRNYLTLPFAQGPQGAKDQPGTWRQACAFAVAPPPGMTVPDVVLSDADFVPMWRFGAEQGQVLPADFATLCKPEQYP